jgi:hypothetical protein
MLTYAQVIGAAPHAKSTPPEVLKYLQDRGIGVTLAAELGLKILKADSLFAQSKGQPPLYPDQRHAIVFQHHSPLGLDVDWWSARLVSPTTTPQVASALRMVHSFSALTEERTFGGKMFCPPNTPPAAYLPHAPSLPDWHSIPKGSRIYFHESAIKAINGARLGTYSIGLNGVWGWTSRKHGIALLPEIRDLDWKHLELQPVIIFDTNLNTSQQVELAAKRLAAKLLEITGRTAKLLRMSTSPDILSGQDYGFDDYAVTVGDVHARQFLDTPTPDLEDIDVSEVELMLMTLNEEVCVVRTLSRVADIQSGALMTGGAFTELVYASYQATVLDAKGNPKDVSVPKLWLRDPRRTQVDYLTYAPGQPRIIRDANKTPKALNTWSKMGVEPQAGPVDQWLNLLSHNAPSIDIADWMLDWLAYPLQYPGAKLNTLLLIFGPSGTGKDLFLTPIHAIYGKNSVKISNDELKTPFTSLYAAKQFVHADELKRVQSAADAVNQKIKGMVTNKTMTVNEKGQPEYKIQNVLNLAITSNYYDCIKLDEDDRRAAVVHWQPINHQVDMRGIQAYWSPLAKWLESDVGAAAIYDYLLSRDLTGFDPAAWAPSTDAKVDVIDAARTPLERFVAQLRSEPDTTLPPLTEGRCLFTANELAHQHLGQPPIKSQSEALSNEMRNQGFVRANSGKSIRGKMGPAKWWIVPRADSPKQDWQDVAVCAAHLRAHNLKVGD